MVHTVLPKVLLTNDDVFENVGIVVWCGGHFGSEKEKDTRLREKVKKRETWMSSTSPLCEKGLMSMGSTVNHNQVPVKHHQPLPPL